MGVSRSANNHGLTQPARDQSYIFVGSIEDSSPVNTSQHNRADTSHECGHQFVVNACTVPQEDTRNAWCDGINHCGLGGATSEECEMHSSTIQQVEDGVDRFCIEDLLIGDPNCVAAPPKPGAIRTDADPQ